MTYLDNIFNFLTVTIFSNSLFIALPKCLGERILKLLHLYLIIALLSPPPTPPHFYIIAPYQEVRQKVSKTRWKVNLKWRLEEAYLQKAQLARIFDLMVCRTLKGRNCTGKIKFVKWKTNASKIIKLNFKKSRRTLLGNLKNENFTNCVDS